MLSITNGILLRELSLRMAFELLIVIALIILFIVSLCSLLQKIRKSYDHHENDPGRISVSQVYSLEVPPSYENRNESSNGVYPGVIAPPPYTAPYEPPPKYDDVIKSYPTVIPAVHQQPQQRQSQNMVAVVTHQ